MSAQTFASSVRSDIDNRVGVEITGRVNLADYAIFASTWLK